MNHETKSHTITHFNILAFAGAIGFKHEDIFGLFTGSLIRAIAGFQGRIAGESLPGFMESYADVGVQLAVRSLEFLQGKVRRIDFGGACLHDQIGLHGIDAHAMHLMGGDGLAFNITGTNTYFGGGGGGGANNNNISHIHTPIGHNATSILEQGTIMATIYDIHVREGIIITTNAKF